MAKVVTGLDNGPVEQKTPRPNRSRWMNGSEPRVDTRALAFQSISEPFFFFLNGISMTFTICSRRTTFTLKGKASDALLDSIFFLNGPLGCTWLQLTFHHWRLMPPPSNKVTPLTSAVERAAHLAFKQFQPVVGVTGDEGHFTSFPFFYFVVYISVTHANTSTVRDIVNAHAFQSTANLHTERFWLQIWSFTVPTANAPE